MAEMLQLAEHANGDSRMIATDCHHCGATVSAFARACGRCGVPNKMRMAVLGLAVALAVVATASVGGAWMWRHAASPSVPGSLAGGGDFAWLTQAMADCDAEAAKDTRALEFLVIPLKLPTSDRQEWKRKSLNDIGNAILLTADDTVEALKRAALSISSDRYVFSIRDEATTEVYKWSQSDVKKFISTDAETIERFKIRFDLGSASSAGDWGAVFVRNRGTCYWVNAVLGS
jgi:hypothetical protein